MEELLCLVLEDMEVPEEEEWAADPWAVPAVEDPWADTVPVVLEDPVPAGTVLVVSAGTVPAASAVDAGKIR